MNSRELTPDLRRRVREASHDRCGYCLSPHQYVMGKLEVEHIVPRSQGGSEDESNLWLSCSLCDRFKGIQVNAADSVEGIGCLRDGIHRKENKLFVMTFFSLEVSIY